MWSIESGEWIWASILVIIGTAAYSSANIFYDAFLTDICPSKERDNVSIRGYAYGYPGGGLLLAINIAIISNHQFFGVSQIAATQFAFVTVGVWWLIFSIPLYRNVHDNKSTKKKDKIPPLTKIKSGINSVLKTFREIRNYPEVVKFLIAFWFYNDAISTVTKMAGIYANELGISAIHILIAILITQFIALPCTLFFGKLADKFSSKASLITSLFIYLIIVVLGYFMKDTADFYLLAILVGLVQGGSQALSRSIFSRIIPAERNAEFFGLFGLSGKFASIVGPPIVGLIGQLTGSSRDGIAALAIFFIVGIIIIASLNEPRAREHANIID